MTEEEEPAVEMIKNAVSGLDPTASERDVVSAVQQALWDDALFAAAYELGDEEERSKRRFEENFGITRGSLRDSLAQRLGEGLRERLGAGLIWGISDLMSGGGLDKFLEEKNHEMYFARTRMATQRATSYLEDLGPKLENEDQKDAVRTIIQELLEVKTETSTEQDVKHLIREQLWAEAVNKAEANSGRSLSLQWDHLLTVSLPLAKHLDEGLVFVYAAGFEDFLRARMEGASDLYTLATKPSVEDSS